jgi:hypothetical protein
MSRLLSETALNQLILSHMEKMNRYYAKQRLVGDAWPQVYRHMPLPGQRGMPRYLQRTEIAGVCWGALEGLWTQCYHKLDHNAVWASSTEQSNYSSAHDSDPYIYDSYDPLGVMPHEAKPSKESFFQLFSRKLSDRDHNSWLLKNTQIVSLNLLNLLFLYREGLRSGGQTQRVSVRQIHDALTAYLTWIKQPERAARDQSVTRSLANTVWAREVLAPLAEACQAHGAALPSPIVSRSTADAALEAKAPTSRVLLTDRQAVLPADELTSMPKPAAVSPILLLPVVTMALGGASVLFEHVKQGLARSIGLVGEAPEGRTVLQDLSIVGALAVGVTLLLWLASVVATRSTPAPTEHLAVDSAPASSSSAAIQPRR